MFFLGIIILLWNSSFQVLLNGVNKNIISFLFKESVNMGRSSEELALCWWVIYWFQKCLNECWAVINSPSQRQNPGTVVWTPSFSRCRPQQSICRQVTKLVRSAETQLWSFPRALLLLGTGVTHKHHLPENQVCLLRAFISGSWSAVFLHTCPRKIKGGDALHCF